MDGALPSQVDFVLRIAAAIVAGTLIGIERESHGRAAGMRTTMLVCVAACLAMLLSETLQQPFVDANIFPRPDPARLAQGVLSGMDFLGAGAIIRYGNRVQGVTTAAALWFVSIVGLAFGAGQWLIGVFGVVFALVVLIVIPRLESRMKNDWFAVVVVTSRIDGLTDQEMRHRIERHGVRVLKVDRDYDLEHNVKTLQYEIEFKRSKVSAPSEAVVKDFCACDGVSKVNWS